MIKLTLWNLTGLVGAMILFTSGVYFLLVRGEGIAGVAFLLIAGQTLRDLDGTGV